MYSKKEGTMTIDEAIRILQFQGAPEEGPTISDFIKAKNLSIKALRVVQEYYSYLKREGVVPLPGETKD